MGRNKKSSKMKGVTIFLTTQYMDEADKLCDIIAIIDNGKIIVTGTPNELKSSVGGDTSFLVFCRKKSRTRLKHC